jgi:hypothetical protein
VDMAVHAPREDRVRQPENELQAFSHRRMSLNEGIKEGSEQGVLS